MNEQIVITQNDTGIELEVQFLNNKKKPIDITGCTVEVVFVNPNNEKIEEASYVKDYINGVCGFVLDSNLTSITGLWRCYFSALDNSSFITAQEALYYFILPMHGGV